MKLKIKTSEGVVVGFSKRELYVIANCLEEACNGVLMDRFLPAHEDLTSMLRTVRAVTDSSDFFKLTPATV